MTEMLHIEKTEDTPEVHFDPGKGFFSVVGRSLPENAYNFFKPLIDFTKQYVSAHTNKSTDLTFKLDYFNSSSGRFIFEMLTIFEESYKKKQLVKVKWLVDKDDELMIEKGEELKSLLDIPFEIQIKE
jgi:hypothetical protein